MEITISFFTKSEIKNFVKRSIPKKDVNFKVLGIDLDAGWTAISCKCDDNEFSINYSEVMTDASKLIEFFAKIIDLKEDAFFTLDNEGSEPLLYAQSLGDDVRFIFAHDYELFDDDEIDDYDLSDYKIECDIIINKKTLLKEFYKVLDIYAKSKPSLKDNYICYNNSLGQKYLNIIKSYLGEN